MKIPFVDLRSLHEGLREELRDVFERVLDASSFVLGPEVQTFEQEFATYVGTKYCVALNTGTAALHLVLASLGVGPGDEVITVPHTFIATAEAISAVGARPVFVDIDPVSFNMDPDLLEAAITPRTRAILPVDLYGQVADMDAILATVRAHLSWSEHADGRTPRRNPVSQAQAPGPVERSAARGGRPLRQHACRHRD